MAGPSNDFSFFRQLFGGGMAGTGGQNPFMSFFQALFQIMGGQNATSSERDFETKLSVKRTQKTLAEQGLYPSTGSLAQDGIAGPLTQHGIKLSQDPSYALTHMQTALQDPKLDRSDIMKIQASLNSMGYRVESVNGRLGNETRDALDKFLKEHPEQKSVVPSGVAHTIAPKETVVERFTQSVKDTLGGVVDRVAATPNGNAFDVAYAKMRGFEGGFSNDKADRGGATMYGISSKNWPSDYKQVMALVNSGDHAGAEAFTRSFYKKNFWDKLDMEGQPPSLQALAFDAAVNHGTKRANSFLKEANGDPNRFLDTRQAFFDRIVERDPSQKRFERGWANRVNEQRELLKTTYAALDEAPQKPARTADASPATPTTPAAVAVAATAVTPDKPVTMLASAAKGNDIDFGRVATNLYEGMEGAAQRLGLNNAFDTAGSLFARAGNALGLTDNEPQTQLATRSPGQSGMTLG